MNNVVDEVLAGSPRYTIKDNGGTTLYDNVQIDLKTQVTIAGTPLNKALFDSIRDDLNTRLLISNKATTSDAQTGTNDTKYMTPLKTRQALNYLTTIKDIATGTTSETLYTFNNSSNAIIRVDGLLGSPAYYSTNYPTITIDGTGIKSYYATRNTSSSDPTYSWHSGDVAIRLGYSQGQSTSTCPFWLEFNMATHTFSGYLFITTTSGNSAWYNVSEIRGNFTSLTSLTMTKHSSIPLKVSITEIV